MLQPFTVADCVAANARSFPDRCAIEVLDPRTTGGVEPIETWTYGGLTLAQLVAGGRARVMTAFEPHAALTEYAHRSTWAFLVPSMTAAIAEGWRNAGRPPLGALRYLLSAGAPGPMSLLDEAFDIFPNAEITDGYGWTEAGWVTYDIKDRSALVPHCVGGPTPGSVVKVVDPETCEEVPDGVAGEVVAMSIVPFEGYLGRPEATAAAHTPDGFARSGDMGIMAADGRLAIVDRVKDMIISGGENVYCAEVERVLVEHRDIAEAAVVGLPDERWGERIAAAVVPHEGSRPEPAEVIDFVRDRLAHYKCPRRLMVVGDLPRNAMGKVLKPLLAQQFGPDAQASSSSA